MKAWLPLNTMRLYFSRTLGFWVGLFIAFLLCVVITILFNLPKDVRDYTAIESVLYILFILLFITSLGFIGYFIMKQLTAPAGLSFSWRLTIILHSYIGTILIFASIYYCFLLWSDLTDAIDRDASNYRFKSSNELYKNEIDYTLRVKTLRAFTGLHYHMWSSIDFPDQNMLTKIDSFPNLRSERYGNSFVNGDYSAAPLKVTMALINALGAGERYSLDFQQQNVGPAIIDCIYFSLVMITTVGSNMNPNTWYAKLATALEVLIGAFIFVLSINFLFTQRSNDTP